MAMPSPFIAIFILFFQLIIIYAPIENYFYLERCCRIFIFSHSAASQKLKQP
jgi:hypothetical protein